MAVIGIPVEPFIEVFFFDGTNIADLITWVQAWSSTGAGSCLGYTYISGGLDGAGNAAITLGNSFGTFTLGPNSYAMADQYTLTAMSQQDFMYVFRPNAPQIALGIATVPSIAAGGTASVTVTLSPAFWDTNWTGVGSIIGSLTVLGQLQVNSVAAASKNTATVVVKNNALLTVAGGQVLVSAQHA
jgi:hypothetical protein